MILVISNIWSQQIHKDRKQIKNDLWLEGEKKELLLNE